MSYDIARDDQLQAAAAETTRRLEGASGATPRPDPLAHRLLARYVVRGMRTCQHLDSPRPCHASPLWPGAVLCDACASAALQCDAEAQRRWAAGGCDLCDARHDDDTYTMVTAHIGPVVLTAAVCTACYREADQ